MSGHRAVDHREELAGWGDEVASDAGVAALVQRAQSPDSNFAGVPAFAAYLQRLEAYQVLSHDEQLHLVRVVQRANAERHNRPVRGVRAQRAWEDRQREAERAGDALVGATFRLVLLIAREQLEKRLGRERALDRLPDMVAEANVALAEAIATFDPDRSPTFAMYAARKVRDRVAAALNTGDDVKIASSWSRLKRIAAVRIPALTHRLGRKPTLEEMQSDLLDACLAWAEEKLTDEQRTLPEAQQREAKMVRLRKQGMLAAIASLDDVLTATQEVAYLDAPVGDTDSATLGDLLSGEPAGASSDMFDNVELGELRRDLMAALSEFTEREQRILMCRYGFVDGEPWTYPRIATEFNVSAERIRQIEASVLQRLRSPHDHYTRLSSHLYDQFDN